MSSQLISTVNIVMWQLSCIVIGDQPYSIFNIITKQFCTCFTIDRSSQVLLKLGDSLNGGYGEFQNPTLELSDNVVNFLQIYGN